jgi:hypothetical protein
LEKPIRVDQNNEIRLKFENGALKFQTIYNRRGSYTGFADSLYFLTGDRLNIRMVPLNPLNNSVAITVKETQNANSKAEASAISDITAYIKAGSSSGLAPGQEFINLKNAIDALDKTLKNNKYKDNIAELFNVLKSVNFDYFPDAEKKIGLVEERTEKLKTNFAAIKNEITEIEGLIKTYPASDTIHDAVLTTMVFTAEVNNLNAMYLTQLKNFDNLTTAIKLVNEVRSKGVVDGLDFLVQVQEVTVNRGKVSSVSMKVSQDGFKLSDSKEIVSDEKKPIFERTLCLTKFKRWVFEAASGVAYTFLSYPKFGTGTDAAGNTIVSDAGNDNFKRLNLTAMFNWNYYIPKSNVHPFFQIGLGANADYPALLTGLGARLSSDTGGHFAISGGFASTWVKSLNKLKIGDKVSGSAELEKDITREFKWPMKAYIGFQYNF